MKVKIFTTLIIGILFFVGSTHAQILDVESTTEGALLPRMTTAQRTAISTPAQSALVYDTTTKSFWYFDNTQWVELGAGGGGTASGDEIKDADNDTKIQVEEGTDDDIIRFDIRGVEHLQLSRSAGSELLIEPKNNFFNVFLGDDSGRNVTSGAFSNTFVGALAGRVATGGNENTIVGTEAGAAITTASGNTNIGRWSGRDITGSQNTTLGYASGQKDTLSSFSTIIGAYSGQNSSGNRNTLIGYGAGQNNEGSYNVFLGRFAGQNSVGSDKLYINNTGADSTGALVYGEFDTKWLRVNGAFNLGTWDSGSSGSLDAQMNLSGAHNSGVNNGSATGTYKLKIEGYNNDGLVVYPIHVMDENLQVDFYLKNRDSPNGNTPQMYFAGDYAIGAEKWATGYRLSVDGKIACEEVMVDLSGSWPDYVFQPEYELKSLEEVQNHINEKGHLPGVPSAEEVEENGIQVGEMNKVLMEKVEELTLYILEQDKALKAAEAARVELDKRLQALENK